MKYTKNNQHSQKGYPLSGFLLILGIAFILSAADANAVQAGEMKTSVDYLKGLMDNNIVPAIIGTGIVAGTGFAFMKSTFSPLVIALSTAIAYGFANKWITTVYALCA